MNVRQAEVSELLPQYFDEFLPDTVLQIVVLELQSLLHGCIPPNGTDVHHSISELQERPALDR